MEQEEHAKHYLRIRNGSVYTWGEGAEVTKVPIAKFAWALPDMDMIVNWLDEPRVLAWDQSQSELTDDEAAELERKVDYLYNLSTIRMFHDDRSKPVPAPPAVSRTSEEEEVIKAYADQKTASAEGWTRADPDLPPLPYDPMKPLPYYDFAAMDIRDVLRDRCPPLREHPAADKAMSLHGFFLAPTSFKPIYHLVPVFTATKPVLGSRGTIHDADAVSCFQDIIIPNHLSLRTKTPPGHNLQPWDKRKEKLIWRGRSTGGQLTYEAPWRNFQRPRAVEYSNKRMAMGDERIDLQFTDVIQCDDGRGGRGGYFDKIDFDYQAEGDEEALERLGEDMRIEAKRRRVSMSHTENDKGNVTYEAGVPEGRDEGEWERDKVSQRIKSALEKLRKANEAKAPAGDAASGTEGGNDEDDGDFEDDGEEEGPEDGPVIENQGPKRRLRKRDGEAEQAPAPAAAPKKGKKASSNEPAGAPQKVVGRFKASGKVTAPKKQKDTVKSAANKKSSGPKKDLIPANATAGMKHPPRPPAPPPPARRKKSSSSDVKKRVNMCSLIKNFYGIGGWMSTSDCMNHKYLFDVDGNTWSQRGFGRHWRHKCKGS